MNNDSTPHHTMNPTPQTPLPQPPPRPTLLEPNGTTSHLENLNAQLSAANSSAGSLVPATPAQDHSLAPCPSSGSTPLDLHFIQPLQTRPSGKPRNGKIAHLPALVRDLVNRMLASGIPHSKIADAVGEHGFTVTARNVSNWKTRGGYKEWCIAQERALELRSFQDNLTEFLRRHDAGEIAEVGLQAVATSISAIFLRPDLMREIMADPQKYAKLVEIQCRLSREIQAHQKDRNDAANSLGPQFNPERVKREAAERIEGTREIYCSHHPDNPRDPDIPYRTFMPKEIEPAPRRIPEFNPLELLRELRSAPAPSPQNGSVPPKSPGSTAPS